MFIKKEIERNPREEEYFMRKALHVAENALKVGEVPVGCVIVLRDAKKDYDIEKAASSPSSEEGNASLPHVGEQACENNADDHLVVFDDNWYASDASSSVIVSHGANQVNATRDATRHSEVVAIDRMLTGSLTTDRSRLPQHVMAEAAHGKIPDDCRSILDKSDTFQDDWVNVKDNENHWKNTYGWGTGRLFKREILERCDLYVTCEPCIMCAAALAKVGIGRVFYGCKNSRFGGNGSILSLHLESELPDKFHLGYPITTGILEVEAINLLRSFYDRENFHAPDEKRKRKPPPPSNNNSEKKSKIEDKQPTV